MKNITFIAAMALLINISAHAGAVDQGTVESITCINNEMKTEEVIAASASFLELKVGDKVLLSDIRALALDAEGVAIDGMGIMESDSKLVLLVKVPGYCQKDTADSAVGTVKLSIQNN